MTMIKMHNKKNIKICCVFVMLMVLAVSIMFFNGCNRTPEGTEALPTLDNAGDDSNGQETPGTYEFLTEAENARLNVLVACADTKVYNVCDFGTVAGEDCTAAIRTAIETVQKSGGGILYFPPGKYNVSEVISFPKEESASLILMGEPGSTKNSEIIFAAAINEDAFDVASSNVSFANINFQSKMKTFAAVRISGDSATVYNCSFENFVRRSTNDALLRVCGTNALLSNLSFNMANPDGYTLNFTKLPGVVSKNNKLFDSHFGGEMNGILIDSLDDSGCPEDVMISRVTLLNYSGGQVDIRSVKNCNISNSMLDQGYSYCIRLDSQGVGIDGVTISENYIAAAYNYGDNSYEKHSITMPDNGINAPISNISILNNMIVYSQYGITVMNTNTSKLLICGNTVSGDFYSMKMNAAVDSTIVSNVFYEECYIGSFSGENVFHSNIIKQLSPDCSLGDFEKDNIVTKKEAA